MATITDVIPRPASQSGLWSWITTVDHKRIGVLYGTTAFIFLLLGGIEAGIIRLQLAVPDNTMIDPDTFNQMFTMHGTTMIFLVVMPLSASFFNFVIPLAIGARDVAFPRLNAFSYWVFLFGGLLLNASFLTNQAPDAGWFSYANLTEKALQPQSGSRLLGPGIAGAWRFLPGGGLQLYRDHREHAGARHEPDAHASVRMDDPGDLNPSGPRFPGDYRGAD